MGVRDVSEGDKSCTGNVDARKNEERQGVNPAPADLQLLAGLRLDACDCTSLMVEQYKVLFIVPHNLQCSPWLPDVHRQLSALLVSVSCKASRRT